MTCLLLLDVKPVGFISMHNKTLLQLILSGATEHMVAPKKTVSDSANSSGRIGFCSSVALIGGLKVGIHYFFSSVQMYISMLRDWMGPTIAGRGDSEGV